MAPDPATSLAILGLALLSGGTTVVGVALALRLERHPGWVAGGIGFSAGIMLLVSVFELVPEAAALWGYGSVLLVAGLGAGAFALLHALIPHTHLVEEGGMFDPALLRSAYLVILGLILHDLPEGFAMANAYLAAPRLGLLLALAIALHNIPEEFAMAVPAIALGRRRLLYRAALVSALAEPVGAVAGLLAVGLRPGLVPAFMGFAAGAMIFVSIHELIPMARRYGHRRLFAAGMAVSGLVFLGLGLLLPAG
ncbi:MAG: ZIP family metal transporter [Gammaproteobacteria bacterium]|nr:ZIP family metal transporter [Gammaproteobacteria bacterium]